MIIQLTKQIKVAKYTLKPSTSNEETQNMCKDVLTNISRQYKKDVTKGKIKVNILRIYS